MSASYPLIEVSKHRMRDSAWIVVEGKVLDVTRFLSEHPGGDDVLLDAAGSDATRAFEDVGHSADARARLASMTIGEVRKPTSKELRAEANTIAAAAAVVNPASDLSIDEKDEFSPGLSRKAWALAIDGYKKITSTRTGTAIAVTVVTAVVLHRLYMIASRPR